jgi:hypothetical protein
MPLLDSEDLGVVSWAASHLLSLRESEAIAALQRASASDNRWIAFSAKTTLQEWRAGRLTVD